MEASSKLDMSDKETKPLKQKLLSKLDDKLPRLIFALQMFIASIGIIFLLIFPLLVLILPFELFQSASSATELKDGIEIAIQLLLLVIAASFSWTIYKLKFSLPRGIEVNETKLPQLCKLISELVEEYGNPRIDRIVLRDKYAIHIIKTPRSGLPFLNTHTLVIGLPVLLTMPPLYFRALLARRIGQLSTKHTPITTRLYFLNDIWQQFKDSCRRSHHVQSKILSFFFKIYNPVYEKIMMPLLQHEELEADSYGMDLINSNDMVECIVYEEVVTHFLTTKFWPKIHHMAKRSKTPQYLPYSQMSKVIKAGITDDEISQTVQAALKQEQSQDSFLPTLSQRLNHLGHSKPKAPKRLTQTAADYYLGNTKINIVEFFDKAWLKKLKASR